MDNTVEVYFNGEYDRDVPSDLTVEEVDAIYHRRLCDEGYDMSGDYDVLSVQFVDGEFQVWYQ